jgi:hypothetical protein
MNPGYHYRDITGQELFQPNLNSKGYNEFCSCGCGKRGTKVVHGADGAWLFSDACYEQLLARLGRGAG